jgi:hypothetical protein
MTIRALTREVAAALLPVIILVVLLHLAVTDASPAILARFLAAGVMVYAGLVLFLLGVRISLLPMGRLVGSQLPQSGVMATVLVMTLVLGFITTFAEPDLRVLGKLVTAATGWQGGALLIPAVSLGVGLFLALAVLRVVVGFSTSLTLTLGFAVILVLTLLVPDSVTAIAFDAGAVTTGPVTVPFMLALGAGVSSVLRGRSELANSFGLIGIASMGPVLAVLLLGMLVR